MDVADILCYEMCPCCDEVFKYVHRYMRHDCKATRDAPKRIFKERRMAQFNRVVSQELDRWQETRRCRKRRRETVSSDLEQVHKTAKIVPVISDEPD